MLLDLSPGKRHTFAGEVDEWASNPSIILNPDVDSSRRFQECAYFSSRLAWTWPISDFCNFGLVWDTPIVVTSLANNNDLGLADEKLFCRDGRSSVLETM